MPSVRATCTPTATIAGSTPGGGPELVSMRTSAPTR